MNQLRYGLTECLRFSTLAAVGLLVSAVDIRPAAAAGAPLKVACIGEQTTHSDQFPSANNQPVGMQEYPAMLGTILGAGYDVHNLGNCCASVISGYPSSETHPYISTAQFTQSISLQPDIVVIGSWGRHDWGLSSKTALAAFMAGDTATAFTKFQADYDTLVSKYVALTPKPKIFCSTPIPILYGMDGPDNGYKTSPAADAIKAVCGKYNLPIIDMFTAFLGQKQYYNQAPVRDSTGEHTNPTGMMFMAQLVANAILGVDGGTVVGTSSGGGGSDAGSASGSGSGSGGSSSGSAGSSSSSGAVGTSTSSSSSGGSSSSGSTGTASGGGASTGTDTGAATGSSGAGLSGSSSGSGLVTGTTGGDTSTDTGTGTTPAESKTGSVGCSAASAAETGAPWGAAVTGILGWALLSRRRNRRRAEKDNA